MNHPTPADLADCQHELPRGWCPTCLRAELAALARRLVAAEGEVERLKAACASESNTVEQILGRALGYPRYCDDTTNFPDATEADGVCVGDNTAASLADEAAEKVTELRRRGGQDP